MNPPSMLVLDAFRGHLTLPVKTKLKDVRTELVVIPSANVQLSFSKNGWMTSDVLLEWMRRIWGPNRDDVQRLLVLDQAPIHKTDATRKALVAKDTDVVFVLSGCTSIVQPADVG
ncbi:hypothetical protein ISCGN_003210 [Ixodes scapularis]